MKRSIRPEHDLDYFAEGILQGDRIVLGQAVTLVESQLHTDELLAESLIEKVIHQTGNSIRIGITGAPGVGKSTFIETFGRHVTHQHKKLAVLTIDPSSQLSRGSILGDKTRMEELSKDPMAFIRPSPASNTLGGVTHKTREAILLCEAAGYEVIIVETVGVGQSEIAVKSMVDFFLLLMLPGAGDTLQGIKKGIVEIADAIVISKGDGENKRRANEALAIYQEAVHLFSPSSESGWNPSVLVSSALTGEGIAESWNTIMAYQTITMANDYFGKTRSRQNVAWFNDQLTHLFSRELQHYPSLKAEQEKLERAIIQQSIAPSHAAKQMLAAYREAIRSDKS